MKTVEPPRISIVTPSLNQGNFLEECMDSILGQNYPNLEYMVMDGGSQDGSVEIIKKYEKHLAYWQSQPDGGQYHAIQKGFERSTGEIMFWLNSSDKLHSGALDLVARVFGQWPEVEWVTGHPTGWDEKGTLNFLPSSLPKWSQKKYLFGNFKEGFIQQESTFWRRTLWNKAGGRLHLEFKHAADFELWARFFRFAQLHVVDAFLGGFRSHTGQKIATIMAEYLAEVEKIIAREKLVFEKGEDKKFPPAPPPLDPALLRDSRKDPAKNNPSVEVVDDGPPSRPLVSVVVSTFNSEKFIRPCLENLSRQTIFSKIEVIVVDSGSEQNEKAVVSEFQRKYSNIHYLRTARETLYAAWNRGLETARGRYWANANTDDTLRNDALEVMVEAMEKNPGVQLGYADAIYTDQPNDSFPPADILQEVCYPDYEPVHTLFYCLTGCFQFWRTSALLGLCGFDPSLQCVGDYEITVRFAKAGWNAVHVADFLTLFYQNPQGISQRNGCADREFLNVQNDYHGSLEIEKIFACRSENPLEASQAWAALALHALDVRAPWRKIHFAHTGFAPEALRKALELDPKNGVHLLLNFLQGLKESGHGNLIREFKKSTSPAMQEALELFRKGIKRETPKARPAVLGPGFRKREVKNSISSPASGVSGGAL